MIIEVVPKDPVQWLRLPVMVGLGIVWVLLMPHIGETNPSSTLGDGPNPYFFWMSEFVTPVVASSLPAGLIAAFLRSRLIECLILFLLPSVFLVAGLIAMNSASSTADQPLLITLVSPGMLFAMAILVGTSGLFSLSFMVVRRLTGRE